MASDIENEGHPRFSIYNRELEKLLSEHAPEDPARTLLKQLVLDLQSALHAGLPLRLRAEQSARTRVRNQLRELQKASAALALLLSSRDEPLRQAVSDILGREMARLLTDDAFEIAGVPIYAPSERELEIIRSRSREPEAEVAAEARSRREARRKLSARVLASFHAHCHALIAAQLEVERGELIGRPSHPEREFILSSIELVFEEIFGKAPTPSETGQYS